MTTYIKNVDVYESKSEMHVSFIFCDKSGANITENIYNTLVPRELSSRYSSRDDWYDFDFNIDIRMKRDKNEVMIEGREKNNEEGLYGKASPLLKLPSILLKKGILNLEEMEKFSDTLYESKLINERHDFSIKFSNR